LSTNAKRERKAVHRLKISGAKPAMSTALAKLKIPERNMHNDMGRNQNQK
jgi:hypothetical protein